MPPSLGGDTLSLSSSLHSVGKTRIFTRVRHHLALSPVRNGRNTTITTTNTTTKEKSSKPPIIQRNYETDVRTTKDACIGSMMALLHYLSQEHHINTETCVQELQQHMNNNNNNKNQSCCCYSQYDKILYRIIQQYRMQLSLDTRNDECCCDIIHMLLLGCWQTQFRYAELQHQILYRQYNNIRFHNSNTSSSSNINNIINNSELQLQLRPLSSFPIILIETTIHNHNNNNNLVEQQIIALRYNIIQMAEYVCTCQKEIILCQRNLNNNKNTFFFKTQKKTINKPNHHFERT